MIGGEGDLQVESNQWALINIPPASNELDSNEDALVFCPEAGQKVSLPITRILAKAGGSKSKRKKKLGAIYNKLSNNFSDVRGRRKSQQVLSEAITVDKEPDFFFSDCSISNENIDHKNWILLKEAEATWEVSSVLGLVFDRDKERMIEVFHNLEKKDRMGRANQS
ncbi:hypothetical protein DITRI_Ditri20bG0010300 [Diplodiscus trichospermus]